MFAIKVVYFLILLNFYLNQNLSSVKIHGDIEVRKYEAYSIKKKTFTP